MPPSLPRLCVLLGLSVVTRAFLFFPSAGQIWDPSCIVFSGITYCFFMYSAPEDANSYFHGSLATSDDGVHFVDRGAIDSELPGVGWFKCFVRLLSAGNLSTPPLFVMDHGTSNGGNDGSHFPDDRGCPFPGQCLRIMSSSNLVNWTHLYTMHPDPQWYDTRGRWDHMYTQQVADGSYVGFPVATPLGSPAPGTMVSPDGLNWTVKGPLNMSWGDVTPIGVEVGGVEYIGGSWWVIGGTVAYGVGGYSMYVFKGGDDPGAPLGEPFAPVPASYRLSGTSSGGCCITALAAFARNYDEGGATLVSQYIIMPTSTNGQRSLAGGGDVWLLPLRLPCVPPTGGLSLCWWPGNAVLAAEGVLPGVPTHVSQPAAPFQAGWLGGFNHSVGAVLEAVLLPLGGDVLPGAAAGVLFEDGLPDAGPDVGFDRPGNDVSCFSGVDGSSACALACEADAGCDAWTWVPGPQVGPAPSYTCSGGAPLPRPYCTLKSPVPPHLTVAPGLVTGLPRRSANATTATALVMPFSLGSPTLVGTLALTGGTGGSGAASGNIIGGSFTVRDESGTFVCGPNETICGDATLTSLDPAIAHHFLAYFRRGMFELYVDGRLVQTYQYGTYPVVSAPRVGFVANNASLQWVNISVRSLTLP